MKRQHIRKITFVGLAIIILLVVFGFVQQSELDTESNIKFSLQAPLFVGIAQAEADEITSFMEDEAGMTCFFQASSGIDLNDVRDVFRTIEVETNDYIIGSLPVPNHPETEDVHAYIHTNGWALTYYLEAEPVAKIFDWRIYHNTSGASLTTKLENTLADIALEAGVGYPGGSYYDFRYPNATKLMFIAERASGGTDEFEVNLPGTNTYFELGWFLAADDTFGSADFYLDGATIFSGSGADWGSNQGRLSLVQLMPDQFHTVGVHQYYSGNNSYGGLVLVYSE